MPKIPYDRVVPEAAKLIEKMAMAKDWDEAFHWWDTYTALLQATGWNENEFDMEYTKRVDQGWDPTKASIGN